MTEPLIRVRDVHRVYRRPRTSLVQPAPQVHALRGVSFHITSGQRFGLVGESGSGKSTLIRLIAGLDSPTSGTITFAGRDVGGQPERRLRFLRDELQVVFQDPMGSLDPRMRVRDVIAEPLAGKRGVDAPARVRELLDAVGLPPDAGERYPHQFSGGQRQRISIARALAPRPSVLVADEPVSALDVSVRAQILNLLADLVESFALTLVFVSHDLSVVRHVCDTIAVLHEGALVELGPAEQVADAPEHPYTRRLVAAVPTIRGALAGRTAADLARGPDPGDTVTSTRTATSSFPVDEDAVIALTRDLVRLRTVHEPDRGGGEAAAAELVADTMRGFGWDPKVTEVAPGRPNVVAVVEGGGGPGPTLAFEGHTDVVTEGDRDRWSVDPYGAEIRDGRLYGRGSADMKSGVAAMLHAVRALQLAGPFPGRVLVCALVDEEGLMLGAKHFARTDLAASVDAAIICEPEEGEICTCAKGSIRTRVDLLGAMAHGAMPQHGRNPLAPLGRLLVALAGLQDRLQAEHPAHEHLGEVYLTPTVAAAGSADQINVIPARATVCVDVRTIPGVDHAGVIAEVGRLATEAGAAGGVGAEVTVVDDRPCVEVPTDHPLVVALAGAHEAVLGEPARYGGVPGATDGTILTRDAGMPTVVYGPGGKWIAHQADEFVEIDEIVRCAHVYAEAADRFLRGRG